MRDENESRPENRWGEVTAKGEESVKEKGKATEKEREVPLVIPETTVVLEKENIELM